MRSRVHLTSSLLSLGCKVNWGWKQKYTFVRKNSARVQNCCSPSLPPWWGSMRWMQINTKFPTLLAVKREELGWHGIKWFRASLQKLPHGDSSGAIIQRQSILWPEVGAELTVAFWTFFQVYHGTRKEGEIQGKYNFSLCKRMLKAF